MTNNKINFTIETPNDNGSGMKYISKEEFMKELGLMIDDWYCQWWYILRHSS